ncbi:MAG: aminomethyl transferase family protein [Gemmatimonadales bacterium]|nr:MAG: aminomethyl transferase family protein [Gemmatimonadales bacterium]
MTTNSKAGAGAGAAAGAGGAAGSDAEVASGLPDIHEAAGGIPVPPGGEGGDHPVRHYGDPAGEYEAATGAVAMVDRSLRGQFVLTGRQPGRMMSGVATGSIPEFSAGGRGRAPGSLVLTPKGRPIADLRILRLEPGEAGALLLDVSRAAVGPLLDHFRRSMPPLFARPRDRTAERGVLTLVGPEAAPLLARILGVLEEEGLLDAAGGEGWAPCPDAEALGGLPEGDEIALQVGARRAAGAEGEAATEASPPATPDPGLRVVGQGDVAPMALDLLGPRSLLVRIWEEARSAGAVPAGRAVWDTLRVEHGRPAFGVDVDDTILPPEAGLQDRLIDHGKGCYTGQEVIVRIRDRGRVNRHLRGLLLGAAPAPPAGTELYQEGRDRAVGEVRSVVQSPRFGQGIALAYVRREVEPGGQVQLGSPGGPVARVRALSPEGWVPEED